MADFYGRMLALEQYDVSNFIGLSRALYKLGDKISAFKVIQILLEFDEKTHSELTQLPAINPFIPLIPTSIAAVNRIYISDSLSRSAELFSEIGEKELAIQLRISLSKLAKDDFENKYLGKTSA